MILSIITESMSKKMRVQLFLMAASSAMLQIANKLTRFYDGDNTPLGLFLAKPSKFLTYFLFIVIIAIFNLYVRDLFEKDGHKIPFSDTLVEMIVIFSTIILVVSQYTGLYYAYDSNNTYHRASLNWLAYAIPIIALAMLLFTILANHEKFSKRMLIPLLLFIFLPMVAGVAQFFFHTTSLTGMAVVANTAVLYCFSVFDTNRFVRSAHENEIKNKDLMLEQTASALAEAIDAKDSYTNGHSRRVAEYSAMIARKAGKTVKECRELYLIALLHDVGKIGIPGSIINKNGKLTDEEYDIIKTHPEKGKEILEKISISPNLSIGAHYHHERFDGKGYPEGLKGEEIPELARIIACADAYDAMASRRSYRDVLPRETIRKEFVKNLGKQFDPTFGQIMIDLIDSDKEYQMREM